MNWNQWHDELDGQASRVYDRLIEMQGHSQLPNHIWLFEEKVHRQLIDEICTRYAETKTWPTGMKPQHIVLIYARATQGANCAQELAAGRHIQNQPSVEGDSERDAAIKFLLVDYWNLEGRKRWLTSPGW